MKHILTMVILCMTITVSAQRGRDGGRMQLSAEQQATLQTKKMTLALDLNDQQANKVYTIQLEQAKKRKAFIAERKKQDRPELTKEQRFELEEKKLDNMIAVQKEMKAILTADQFEKWRKIKLKRQQKGKRKHHRRR
ncbi:hypothetical protein [Dokdonia pacifica]|uniref:LTXXQ motif family protein n=2 Tax=Dokdonia pacifica TaxID=1627892 RepID=A0A238VR57_9FLAO|nr:hypothetical protein [Dokdonia pacifica]SNR35969.1 hypothetical protein SAMN06265376_101118 [Dokdonia pacifica]